MDDEASGLSAPQLSALSVVVFAGPITMGELAVAEQVRPPTISRLIKGLETDGLVERANDPNDERVQRISTTPNGRRLLLHTLSDAIHDNLHHAVTGRVHVLLQ